MLELLRARLAELPEVRLAAAFGSMARGQERPGSDLDLALLLDTVSIPRRWEIEAALGRTAGREVDFVYLNEAPPLLRFEIASDGVLLLERHPGDWSDARAQAMIDWWDWAPTAKMITGTILRRHTENQERSQPEIATHKVARAHARLDQAEALVSRLIEEFVEDLEGRDLASFYLLLAIQEVIDLAAHWVADAGWVPPTDAGSTFEVLADHGAIDRELASRLRAAVGLRNRIAHDYGGVDHARLHAEFAAGVEPLRRFLVAVADAAGL